MQSVYATWAISPPDFETQADPPLFGGGKTGRPIVKCPAMTEEEIEQGFVDAGWELDSGFSGYLIIGENGDQSILAHRWAWGTEDTVFELSYWVRAIPTPQQAGQLLEEYGCSSEEERGNPYK